MSSTSSKAEGEVNKGGRPSALTPETWAKALEGYKLYGTHVATAGYVGVDPHTLKNWRDSNVEFMTAAEGARAAYVMRRQAQVEAHETPDVALRMARIVGGDEYNPKDRSEISGEGLAISLVVNRPVEPAP